MYCLPCQQKHTKKSYSWYILKWVIFWDSIMLSVTKIDAFLWKLSDFIQRLSCLFTLRTSMMLTANRRRVAVLKLSALPVIIFLSISAVWLKLLRTIFQQDLELWMTFIFISQKVYITASNNIFCTNQSTKNSSESLMIKSPSFCIALNFFLECHVTWGKLDNEFNIDLRQHNEESDVWLIKKKLKDGGATSAKSQFHGKWF